MTAPLPGLVDEVRLAALRSSGAKRRDQAALFNTIEKLWKVAHAARRFGFEYLKHGRDPALDGLLFQMADALAAVGLNGE